MKKRIWPALAALALLLPWPLPAQEPAATPGAAPAAQPTAATATPTLAEFAQRLAAGLNLPAPASGWSGESAAWALVGKGITLRADLSAPLTEADVVAALSRLGYRLRTSTPSRVLSRDRLEVLLEAFGTAPAH